MIARLDSTAADFAAALERLLATEPSGDEDLRQRVSEILAAVRGQGDSAVLDFARRFDAETAASVAALEVPRSAWEAALAALPGLVVLAATAANRRRLSGSRSTRAPSRPISSSLALSGW